MSLCEYTEENGLKTEKEVLTTPQRFLELLLIPAMLLLFGFLAYHQAEDTGFFTDEFGTVEQFCLYGPIFVSLAAPLIRAGSGRRNPARPFEAVTHLFLALGSLWLLIVFPFDFPHLADALPEGIRFILSWVTNDIGKIPLIIQVILEPIMALLTARKYLLTRQRLSLSAPTSL